MKTFFLIILFSISCIAQSIDKISGRCKIPFSSTYAVVLVDNDGNVTNTPCPNKFINFPVGFKIAGDIASTPIFPTALNYFLLKNTVTTTNQFVIGSDQELNITENTNNPAIFGTYQFTTVGGSYTGGNLTAAHFEISNRLSVNASTANLVGVDGSVDIDALAASAIGGTFAAGTGGSGGGATPIIIGVNGIAYTHNTVNPYLVGGLFEIRQGIGGGTGDTVIGSAVQAKLRNFVGTYSDARGFSCDTWTVSAGSVTKSACIFADTSIDTFGTLHYFINFVGASPSNFGGDIAVTDNTKGFILKSPDNTCHRIAVSNGNALSASTVTCP